MSSALKVMPHERVDGVADHRLLHRTRSLRLGSLVLVLAILVPGLAAGQSAAEPSDSNSFTAAVTEVVGRPKGLTADTAAKRAVKASPIVERRAGEVRSARAYAKKIESARLPRVAASAGYTRLSEVELPELAPGFRFPVILNSYALSGQVALPLSDYVFSIPPLLDAARAGTQAAEASEEASELDVANRARIAYYEWARSRLGVLVAERLVDQVDASLAQVRALAEVQRLSRADLLRVEAQRAQAELTLAQLKSGVALREQELRMLIDAGPEESLAIGEDVSAVLAPHNIGDLDSLLAKATQKRRDLKAIDAGLVVREKQSKSNRAGQYPRLSAFGQLDYLNPNQRIIPAQERFDLTWSVGLQLSWSLTEVVVAGADVDEAEAQIQILRADRKQLLDGIRLEISAALEAIALAHKAEQVSREGLAAAEESYRVRRELLAAERATAVEIVDAETQLTQARFAAIDAQIDLRVALAKLRHAIGEELP